MPASKFASEMTPFTHDASKQNAQDWYSRGAVEEVVLTYAFGLGCGNVRANRVVVLDDIYAVEPLWFQLIGVYPRIRVADVQVIGIAVGACGHGLEIMHALFGAPVGSADAEDGRQDRLADVSVGAPDLQGAQCRP